MKLSLRKIFIFLLILAMLSLLILSGLTLFFGNQFIRIQDRLLDTTTIDSSRSIIRSAISDFLIREIRLLSDINIEELADIPDQSAINEKFTSGLKELAKVVHINPELIGQYEKFLVADQKLYDSNYSLLSSKNQLRSKVNAIDAQITELNNQTDGISGFIALENKKIEHILRDELHRVQLKDTTENRKELITTITNYTSGGFAEAQQISYKLNSELATLSTLIRKIAEATNSDELVDLKNNYINQLVQSIRKDLRDLKEIIQDHPNLFQVSAEISTQFESLVQKISGSPDNLIRLRKQYLHDELERGIKVDEIKEILNDFNTEFSFIDMLSIDLRNILVTNANYISYLQRLLTTSIIFIVLILMLLLGYLMLRALTRSLNTLIETMKRVSSDDGNLNVRIEDTNYEDLNEVSQSFNTMTCKLQFINQHLQELVELKTNELSVANCKLEKDIKRRIEMEKKVKSLHQKLLESARRAGMADIASSVMHNIGNVLNSTSVSANILNEKFENAVFSRLTPLVSLLNEHAHDLPVFLTQSEKGKLVLQYLIEIEAQWQKDQKIILNEVISLNKNIKSIKEILEMQKSISKKYNITEDVTMSELLDNLISVHKNIITKHHITIVRDYMITQSVNLDKFKVEQIIDNLVRNAIDALINSKKDDKRLIIQTLLDKDKIIIRIIDNGEGIDKENIARIFNFGFTTKQSNMGFGLHISSLAAGEMHGKLEVSSEGKDKGATFTLVIPNQIENMST
ncbi:MAG: ATP-binding protein [Gammaproteobacteria bacterium]|nr:ATP-binding protein [Gammaproteobacteria bacterium]